MSPNVPPWSTETEESKTVVRINIGIRLWLYWMPFSIKLKIEAFIEPLGAYSKTLSTQHFCTLAFSLIFRTSGFYFPLSQGRYFMVLNWPKILEKLRYFRGNGERKKKSCEMRMMKTVENKLSERDLPWENCLNFWKWKHFHSVCYGTANKNRFRKRSNAKLVKLPAARDTFFSIWCVLRLWRNGHWQTCGYFA